ncbi:MAG: SIMPL domain-containing protein [Methanospirillum sp.]|uniref:SIMPL domain-containing protein n=1 Tax=Methanospirillum sp. TaxID=45200 RepID=UPI0023697F66|nr:SIMPL domain-containing protein [Methanospirillum sp.]MDD1729433.1 SIMPL domain-containing protein [Methanospirillum sp.]
MQIKRASIVLVLLLFCLAGLAGAEETSTSTKEQLIHVSGNGIVKTTPDRCEISFSVVTKNPDVKAAQKENARKMDTVMAMLKDPSKGNLTSAEISTSSYSISEVYSPDDALKAKFGENVTIYEVSNTVTIETSDLESVGDLIDMAVSNGANEVKSLQFTLSKPRTAELRSEALRIAVEKARADADAVTLAMGCGVGSVHEVTVEDSYNPPVYYNQDMRSAKMVAAGPSTPIEPGSVDVSAQVSIAYMIV